MTAFNSMTLSLRGRMSELYTKCLLSPPRDNDVLGNFIIGARPAAEKGGSPV